MWQPCVSLVEFLIGGIFMKYSVLLVQYVYNWILPPEEYLLPPGTVYAIGSINNRQALPVEQLRWNFFTNK